MQIRNFLKNASIPLPDWSSIFKMAAPHSFWVLKMQMFYFQISDIEVKFDQIETENARLRFQLQENEAQRDKLMSMRQEFDRAADRYNSDIERLTEKLQNIQFQYEKAKAEKEKIELQSLKLNRDLETATQELSHLREQKGLDDSKYIETSNETERMIIKLEDIHAKFDKAQLELKSITEEKEKYEVESRKFRNQLDHARGSLDYANESESRMRQEMELTKRDMSKIQDKLEQSEAELRRVTREKEQMSNDMVSAAKLKDNDVDKLELEITQLNTERDQLVRQLEKSQDMLLSFQQDLNMTESELKRVSNENRRLREESMSSEKGMMESKEREIRNLNDKMRTIERDHDELIQRESREKIKADRAERELGTLKTQIEVLEAQIEATRKPSITDATKLDSAKFDAEIAR